MNLTLVDRLSGVVVVVVGPGPVGVGAGDAGPGVSAASPPGDARGVEKGVVTTAGDEGGVLLSAPVVSVGSAAGVGVGIVGPGVAAGAVGIDGAGPGSGWVTGVNFLRNCRFLSVTLPLPSILTLYLLYPRSSMTSPDLSHFLAIFPAPCWFWIMTL